MDTREGCKECGCGARCAADCPAKIRLAPLMAAIYGEPAVHQPLPDVLLINGVQYVATR